MSYSNNKNNNQTHKYSVNHRKTVSFYVNYNLANWDQRAQFFRCYNQESSAQKI